MKIKYLKVILFCLACLIYSGCSVSANTKNDMITWQLDTSHNSIVSEVPTATNLDKTVDALGIRVGEKVTLSLSIKLPKDFGSFTYNKLGVKILKYNEIEIVNSADIGIFIASDTKFQIDGVSFTTSILGANGEKEVNTLFGVPFVHQIKGRLISLRIGAINQKNGGNIDPETTPPEIIQGMQKLAGKTLKITGTANLTAAVVPDIAYQGYCELQMHDTKGGTDVISVSTGPALVTYGRRFAMVDVNTQELINDSSAYFIVQNKNVDSQYYEQYYAFDSRTNTYLWVKNQDNPLVKQYHLGTGESVGKFEVMGLVGHFELIEKKSPTDYLAAKTGIPFRCGLGTYEQSGGSIDYIDANGKVATEERQLLESYPLKKNYNNQMMKVKIEEIILIGTVVSLLLIGVMIYLRKQEGYRENEADSEEETR